MRERFVLDSVGLHVLHNALVNIAAEMALVMMKTSYSTIFNEGLDFTTVLLDREGNLIAEKNYTPSMMGAIPQHRPLDAGGVRRGLLPPGRRRRPQRPIPWELPSPRAHDDEAGVRRGPS